LTRFSGHANSRQLAPAGLLAIAVAFGFARYGYGLFVPEFRDAFGLSTEALGFIAAGAYASYLAALLATGALVARVGPRLPVVIGGLSAAVGMAMIALAANTPMLVAGVLLAATSPGWSWAPFSDAVARMIRPESQSRTLSIITTGTTFGILVAGPAALLAGGAWRGAWIAFAIVALAATTWNAFLLPAGPHSNGGGEGGSAQPELRWQWFIGPRSLRLFAVAASFGFAGTVYWTYAVDLVSRTGGFSPSAGPLLWTAVGITGITGVATGDLISRLGLRLSLVAALTALGIATGAIGAAPTSWVALGISAALFGSSFMVLSALLVTWTSNVFPVQPGTGFSATQVFLAAGTITGPALMGVVAGRFSMETAFIITALLALLTVLVRPKEEVHSAGQEDSTRSEEREGK
jgi:predicted MFS family arabinose efflux permease